MASRSANGSSQLYVRVRSRPETLPADRVALHAARVRAGPEEAVGLARDRRHASRGPRRPDGDVVATPLQIGDRPRVEARLERERLRREAAREERRDQMVACGTRARRSPPGGSSRDRRGGGTRAAPIAPAGPRREFPTRGTARRREARGRDRASCAAAFPASSDDGSPSSSQNICARVPSGQPSAGMTGELWSQPPLGVAEIMFPKRSAMSRCTVPRPGSPEPTVAAAARRDGRRPSPGW